MQKASEMKVENLDHLGLIAGLIDDIGIVQKINFILATNVLDASQLNPDEMIVKYKEQQSAERGFGFLKDPLFFTDSVFLKSPGSFSEGN